MTSLINALRNKFLEAIRSVAPPENWKVLVVDEHSLKLLGTVLKKFDILHENVTAIELITNPRSSQLDLEAIYLLMPTTQNVDRIIKDFSTDRKYAAGHLLFVEALAEPLFNHLTRSGAETYLKGFKELFVNFWATEAQVFSVKDAAQFFSMYSPPRNEQSYKSARARLEEDLRFTSKVISNLCIFLNEFPYIRFYMPPSHLPLGPLKPHPTTCPPPPTEGSSRWRTNLARGAEARAYEAVESDHATKLLAFMVQRNLEEHAKANQDFGKHPSHSRPRATLLITDRTMDMIAPFVHEFTYQAMANDLLTIEDGSHYTYKFQSSLGAYEDKTAILSDSDTIWTELRHSHMREAIEKLQADFNKFLQDHAVFKGENASTLDDMKEMLANLPQYQEQREKFSLHLSIAQECMRLFMRDKLEDIANVEQNCATGLTAEGKTPKGIVEQMVPLLDNRDIINSRKIRVIALYIQYRDGVPEEDRRRLYQHAHLTTAEQDAINALTHLGVRITRGPLDKDKKKLKHKPSAEEEWELSRYKPILKTIVEDQLADKLDQTLFPYVKDQPSTLTPATSLRSSAPQATSLRSQKPAWHRAPKSGTNINDNRQRLLVFIAGGMSYSEKREIYHLSSKLRKDIFIGSTHTITPRQFIDDLKVLELSGVGSKAAPNGLRFPVNVERTYQEYYDERYFTQDTIPQRVPQAQASKKSSATSSFVSTGSSTAPSSKEEKKKKKGIFRSLNIL